MRTILSVLAASVIALILICSSFFTVDRAEYVYVTQFGKPVQTYDGEKEAGLHGKLPWPVQSVQRLDHRLQVFDLAGVELLTHEGQTNDKTLTIDKALTVSAYVCWRIAGTEGVDRFIRTIGAADRAEAILGQRISSRLGAEIGNLKMDDLISVASPREVEARMDALSQRLLEEGTPDEESPATRKSLRESARQDYGIELVDIRLRRFNYPPQVREAIFDRIRSERNKKVADYQSQGEQLAKNIRSQAEFEERTILADARAAEQRLRGQAEADADRIRNEAHSKDVAFYAFLKKLGDYQRILGDNKTVLFLSAHRELFDLLFKPPAPQEAAPASKPGAVPASPHPVLSRDGGGAGSRSTAKERD